MLSRFSSDPGKAHWTALKRILRYLQGTINKCLFYRKGSDEIAGFCDADWAGDTDSRRSTTGYIFMFQGGAISWLTKRQQTVALSSTEAELMSTVCAIQESLWLKRLQTELVLSGPKAMTIFCDNKSAISLSSLQLWDCFIDDEVLMLVVESTNEYAAQNNDPEFVTTMDEEKSFLGILYITGYHTLPNIPAYWSNRESLDCEYIKRSMSRDRFKQIKKYIHVCDNQNLRPSDKFAKVSPLNDTLNKKFMQFGVFSHNLSIDEQMITYYGRHSCKMFIKSKPIRFGYKYWCLTSDDGYCYQFIPYAGAATKFSNDYSLGENVVLQLLSHLERPENHNVTFDNFFTSYKLMRRLRCNGYFATGTVRDNRTNYAPLVCTNNMKKRPRGSSDFVFDRNSEVLVTRWNGNSVVTIMPNFLKHETLRHVKRYDRKGKKMITVRQPLLIHEYNHRMGGVDLFDNAMNNYRIKIRGKKWYWPLLTNAFDAANF
ncbi:piggyBac transposable element-derived protein 3-like [Rhagoletis pomonella]|uniref:piggyBac transposable element-derived protein 3-like n=1 Tax=Rhagoletis pomonella TaxID=28610 RepID=UPI001780FFE0|nr:piggyBac transposable element-derived protein 3-like [Rhagoletis pomonella]